MGCNPRRRCKTRGNSTIMSRKMIVLTTSTHSQLFSIKNEMMTQRKAVLTYDEVIQQLINLHNINADYQLEEKLLF